MIQLRKKLNSDIQRFQKRVGELNFIVETVPSLLLVKESNFNPEKLIDQMEQTDLPAKFFGRLLNAN
jgi:hypothetical protein